MPPIEPEGDDLDQWLEAVTADPHGSGLITEIERLRREEDDTDTMWGAPTSA